MPYLDRFNRKYQGKGVKVLVVNGAASLSAESAEYVRKMRFEFDFVHAPEGWKHELGERASTFILDQNGRVQFGLIIHGPIEVRLIEKLVKGLLKYGTAGKTN